MLLNTSFNENEPIVDTPGQAVACFLRTRMDALVVRNTMLIRQQTPGRGNQTSLDEVRFLNV